MMPTTSVWLCSVSIISKKLAKFRGNRSSVASHALRGMDHPKQVRLLYSTGAVHQKNVRS
jgi:hypothetical protein